MSSGVRTLIPFTPAPGHILPMPALSSSRRGVVRAQDGLCAGMSLNRHAQTATGRCSSMRLSKPIRQRSGCGAPSAFRSLPRYRRRFVTRYTDTLDSTSCISRCEAKMHSFQQADEHAQTSVSEHGDRHSPRPAGAPDGAEAARRVAQAGRAAIRRQNPSSRGRGAEGLCLGAASLHSGHLRGIGPPNRGPGRTLIPGDGAAGDQNRPACPAMAATQRLRAVPSQRLPGAGRCPWRSRSGPRSGRGGGAAVPGPGAARPSCWWPGR